MCVPFNRGHTPAETLDLIQETLHKHGFNKVDLESVTMDTTSSSFNTLDPVEVVNQIPCFAHMCNLMLQHAVEEVVNLNKCFYDVKRLMVRLNGMSSTKRKF